MLAFLQLRTEEHQGSLGPEMQHEQELPVLHSATEDVGAGRVTGRAR